MKKFRRLKNGTLFKHFKDSYCVCMKCGRYKSVQLNGESQGRIRYPYINHEVYVVNKIKVENK